MKKFGNKLIFLVVLTTITLAVIVLTSCSVKNQPGVVLQPPLNNVVVTTIDGNSIVSMTMQLFSNSLTKDDIERLKADVRNELCGRAVEPDGPQIDSNTVIPEGSRIVAFGYAIRPDGVPSEYLGTVGNQESVAPIYRQAVDWFISELNKYEYYVIAR